MVLQVVERGFPHDDTLVLLPGCPLSESPNARFQEVMFAPIPSEWADGTPSFEVKTQTTAGCTALSFAIPVADGQRIASEYEVGKYISSLTFPLENPLKPAEVKAKAYCDDHNLDKGENPSYVDFLWRKICAEKTPDGRDTDPDLRQFFMRHLTARAE